MPPASKYRKSIAVRDRRKGCFGTPIAFFGVDEAQGRGSLHMHAILWGGIPPDVIHKFSHDDDLVKTLTDVVETMYSANVPENYQPTDNDNSYQRFALTTCPNPSSHGVDYLNRLYGIINWNNKHSHSFTCHKSKSGKYGCRFLMPATIVSVTGPIQLQYCNDKSNEQTLTSKRIIDPPPPNNYEVNPLPAIDPRIISFELKRPTEYDRMIVPFSPICSSALACNTAVHPVFNPCSAQSVAFYTLKYMTKDSIQIVNSLSCIREAKAHIERNKSTADNSSDETRKSQFLLTRLINNVNSKGEISAQMAAASLLGLPSTSMSHETVFCFPWALLKSGFFDDSNMLDADLDLTDDNQNEEYKDEDIDEEDDDTNEEDEDDDQFHFEDIESNNVASSDVIFTNIVHDGNKEIQVT